MIRTILVTFALAVLTFAFLDRPQPVKTSQVDYCVISYRAKAVDNFGIPHIVWTNGWGPCSQLDRYENI